MRRLPLVLLGIVIGTFSAPTTGHTVVINLGLIELGDTTAKGSPILIARDYGGFTIANLDYDPLPARIGNDGTRLFLTGAQISAPATQDIFVTLAFDEGCPDKGTNCPDDKGPGGNFRDYVASVAGFFSEDSGKGSQVAFRASTGVALAISRRLGPFSPSESTPEFSQEEVFQYPFETGPNIHGEIDLTLFAGDSITLAFQITRGPLGFFNTTFPPRPTSDPQILLEIRPIPEPASVVLFGLGLAILACRKRIAIKRIAL